MNTVDSIAAKVSDLNYIQFETFADGLAARVTVNRPDALNALNPDVISQLGKVFALLGETNCRCMVLTGAGEKAFVAGADIKAMTTMSSSDAAAFARAGQKAFRSMEKLSFATIASINGFALGGGLELAMGCDILVAADTAKLGLPEVSLGLIPGFGGTQRLARVVGLNKAREMLFTGGMYTAEQARDFGLVNQVYPAAELKAAVEKIAKTICSRGPLAIKKAKQAALQGWDLSLDEGLELEAKQFGGLFGTADQREGTTAFVEKRSPKFTGN